MKETRQHKYLVGFFAFLALMLLVISFAAPRIRDYNNSIEDAQKELKIEANGTREGTIIFSKNDYSPSLVNSIDTLLPAVLFLNLVLTRRIKFSFLAAFLFLFQLIAFVNTFYLADGFSGSYFFNYPYFYLIFAALAALSFWEATLIGRFFEKISQTKAALK